MKKGAIFALGKAPGQGDLQDPSPPPVRYVAIFRANLPAPAAPICFTKKGLQLSLESGPIEFSYSRPITTYQPPMAGARLARVPVRLPPDSYLMIDISMKGDPLVSMVQAALQIAEMVALVDLRYPGLIPEKIYQGVVDTPESSVWIPEGPMTLTAAPVYDPETVASAIESDLLLLARLPSDRKSRFQLAARWFRRGYESVNLVDRFLSWWTVVEVYPGKGNTNIVRGISELLNSYLNIGLPWPEVKAKLSIGLIYGRRRDIVHRGKAFVEPHEENGFDDLLERLRAIATTCLRSLAGLPPGNELDQYLREERSTR